MNLSYFINVSGYLPASIASCFALYTSYFAIYSGLAFLILKYICLIVSTIIISEGLASCALSKTGATEITVKEKDEHYGS